MTLQQILAMTGEDFNSMNKSQMIEVNKILAGAARKRLKALPKGMAYTKLLRRANNTVNTGTNITLFMSKGQIKMSVTNKASLQDLKALRKDLFTYLKDPTSTKKGYKKVGERLLKEMLSHFHNNVDEYYSTLPKSEVGKWTALNNDLVILTSGSDLCDFGGEHLGWTSGNNGYKNAIAIAAGGDANLGYRLLHSNDPIFLANFKAQIQSQINERLENARNTNLTTHEENQTNLTANYDPYGFNN